MTRASIIAVAIAAVLSLIGLGVTQLYRTAYQAGWDASESVSAALREATLQANREAVQRASDRLAFNLGQAAVLDQRAEDILTEIQSYEEVPAPGVCGISVDRMRQLEAIR
jgi:hypothetical protein